jgi:hypothetical protein
VRRVFLVVVACAALLAAFGSSAVAAPPATAVDALYVVNTSGGSFDGQVLTLRDVAPAVAWFADRPARVSGVEPMRAATRQLFTGAAPNAALDLAGGYDRVYAVTLHRPLYDAAAPTLRYRVTTLPSLTSTKLGHLEERRTSARIPRTFGSGSLFIDDGEVAATDPLASLQTVGDQDYEQQVIAGSAQRTVVVGSCDPASPACHTTLGQQLLDASRGLGGVSGFFFLDWTANPAFAKQFGNGPYVLVFFQGREYARLPENATALQIVQAASNAEHGIPTG